MLKSAILFKAPAVTVHKASEPWDGRPLALEATLKAGNYIIMLDADATELLIGYLQVIRAYFSSFPQAEKIIQVFYKQIAQKLHNSLKESGNQVVHQKEISALIEEMGCISDWQQWYSPDKNTSNFS